MVGGVGRYEDAGECGFPRLAGSDQGHHSATAQCAPDTGQGLRSIKHAGGSTMKIEHPIFDFHGHRAWGNGTRHARAGSTPEPQVAGDRQPLRALAGMMRQVGDALVARRPAASSNSRVKTTKAVHAGLRYRSAPGTSWCGGLVTWRFRNFGPG